ncbi:MAG: FtsX-like permease family protein [Cryomorphaceae bacterium]
MDLSFFIAKRYLFSKKSLSIITIMSMISMLVVAAVTMAMVVILSAFNGIESLIDSRYSYFDSDLSVIPLTNKVFSTDSLDCLDLQDVEGVKHCALSIEERVFAQYEDNQRIVILKGVEDSFISESGLDSMIIDGEARLYLEDTPQAVIGIGVKYDLDLRLFEQVFNPLRLSAVIRGKELRRNLTEALNKRNIPVAGVFTINIDFDSDYVIVPLKFASNLLEFDNEYSTVDIRIEEGAEMEVVQARLQKVVGENYRVRSRLEKNEIIYKSNKTEKWATFLIMAFIMLIATFNIIAALTLLINEKRHDIAVLTGMGATVKSIRRIFFLEGALINTIGALVGMVLGLLFVYLQQELGLIRLEGGLVEFYPVEMEITDFIAIFGLVVFCGILSSIAPVRFFTRKYASG